MASRSELYINWNKALVDYFISTSTSTVFYVTDSKINDIGLKYCIDKEESETFVDCFIRAISFFIEKRSDVRRNSRGRICYKDLRNDLFCKLQIQGYTSQTGEKSKDSLLESVFGDNNASVLDFAVFLTKHTILTDLRSKTELQYPYFSYVIFVLLGFNKSENREWKDVKDIFESNGIYFCNNDRAKVASLFKHLIDKDKVLTPSCVQTQDPYIKYLKYHSVLKPGDKNLFDEILFEHHIQWDTRMVYGDIRDLIWRVGIRNIQQYEKLREALLDTHTRPYFESLIKNFDREEYALRVANETNAGNNGSTIKGHFRYVADCLSRSSQIWLQYIKPKCAVSNSGITLTPIYTYADNYRVDVRDKDRILWADYASKGLSYKDSKYSVSSKKSDLYFFEIIEGRLLAEMIEPEQLAGKACFLIINRNKKDKQNIIKYHHAQQIDIRELHVFDDRWEAYCVPQYVPKQSEVEISFNQTNQLLRYAQVCFDNSITIDRKIYLLEAFPYIVTEGIDDPSNEVDISISDIYGNNVSFKKKIVRNRIYLYDFDNVSCGEIKTTITVDDLEETRSYRVTSNVQVPLATARTCARFDKWGCYNNNLQDYYYSDNEIIPSKSTSCKNVIDGLNYVKSDKQPYNRLMSILYLLGNNLARDYTFGSNDLDNVLNYLADYEGETLTQYEIKRLKYALRNLGILTHYYENGKYVYETNTPRLVPLRKERILFNNGRRTDSRELYLLYGTYSQSIYDELYDVVDHFEYKPIELGDKLNKYIPPYIVVGICRDQKIDSIQICDNYLFDDLMDFAGKVSELDQDENVFRKYNYIDNEPSDYPVMVPSNRDRGRKEMLRLSANDVLDNDDLSPDLLHTYIRYKHNEPVWFVDKERCKNSELYFRSDWLLPFYVRKALVVYNSALPEYLYAFGMNGILGTERLFYKMYTYKCDAKDKLKAVLGGIDPRKFESASISSIGLKMYAIKTVENELKKEHVELYIHDKLLCYTKQDKVFYCNNGVYNEVISDKQGIKMLNAKLSAVLNLYIHCIPSIFEINEWINDYLCINSETIDTPSENDGVKFEVKIINPIIK
jgi:hypothetical protein